MTKPKLKLECDPAVENQDPASGRIVEVHSLTLNEALTIVRALVNYSRINVPREAETK